MVGGEGDPAKDRRTKTLTSRSRIVIKIYLSTHYFQTRDTATVPSATRSREPIRYQTEHAIASKYKDAMPRPPAKRSRPYRSGPQRVSNRSPSNVPRISRDEVNKKLVNKSLGEVPSNSDDSDELVTARKGLRNRPTRTRFEIYGSGALGKGDEPQAHKEYQEKKRRANATVSRKASASKTPPAPHVNTAPSSPAVAAQVSKSPTSSLKSILKSPAVPPATIPAPASMRRPTTSSGLSTATPGAVKASFADLKPRKRQPSLLAGLRQDVTTLEDTQLSTGSALGLDEFDDIVPNDESTPLNSTKSKRSNRSSLLSQPPSIIGKKRKILDTDLNGTPLSHSRRLLDGSSPTSVRSESGLGHQTPEELPLPPMPTPRVSYDDDAVNAPPLSSSSPASSPKKSSPPPPQKADTKKESTRVSRRQAKPGQSKMTTGALQALLPSRRQTTAANAADEYDIPSSQSAGHEDEESFLPAKKLRKTKTNRATTNGITNEETASKQIPKRQTNATKVKKGPTPITTTVSPLKESSFVRPAAKNSFSQQQGTKIGQKVTYSSRRLDISAGDKENLPFGTSKGVLVPEDDTDIINVANPFNPAVSESTEDHGDGGEGRDNRGRDHERRRWADIDAFALDFEELSDENLGGNSFIAV